MHSTIRDAGTIPQGDPVEAAGGSELDVPATPPRPVIRPRQPLWFGDSGRAARRQAPIHAYVGGNGGGKSLAMVHDTLPSLHSGRKVLSTVELIDARTGEPWPNYERLVDWQQLLDARHADVLFDEVVGVASSREAHGLPVQVANVLVQLRRRDVVLRWSAPAWGRADKIIRECSQAVTVCRGMFSAPAGDGIRLWREKRLFRWNTYSTVSFEEWTASKQGRLDRDAKGWFWRPGSEAMYSYRTLDDVSRVGETLDSGRCAHCGGTRPRPKCTCDAPARGAAHSHG